MIDRHAQNIIAALKKEYAYYVDLLEISKTKKNLIIEGKISELDKIVKLENNMIFDIGQLEKVREQETENLCSALGLDKKGLILTELAKKLEPKYSEHLVKLQKMLTQVFDELKDLNQLNGKLIEQSLEYIDYSINVITSSNQAVESLYEGLNNKTKNTENKKRLFDTKV